MITFTVEDRARAEIARRFKQLGITDPLEMAAFIERNANASSQPSIDDYRDLLHKMDNHLFAEEAEA